MTSDILKRAAEAIEDVTPGPWAVCDRWNVSGPKYEVMNGSIMVRDDAESDANARFIAAARTLIPDMAAAIAERDEQIARLKEDRRQILEERDRTFALMLARAEAAEAMADRLAEGMGNVRRFYCLPPYLQLPLDDAYEAHAAMKEGR